MSSKALADGVDVGTVVAGTYKIVSILGRGGMGTVWEAHHQRLPGKRVAIKVLHPSVSEDTDALARFRREAEIACRLGHANIVEVHDFNSLDDGTPYLILELLEGESLDARLSKGAIPLVEVEQILRQVASALQCAHEEGVVHRDLKPQNIFLVPSPSGVGPEIAKVLDFGISKIRGSQTVKTQESTLLGTPQYMAPEQATGQHDAVDARTDMFALAVMLYELLSNRAAFPGKSIPEVVYKVVHVDPDPITDYVPELSPNKAAALHKAMSKAQSDRFATIGDFVLAFTGEALAPTRTRVTPAPGNITDASTASKTQLAAGSAATIDSQKVETPRGIDIGDIAGAETIDSQKTNLAEAMAKTIDSGSIDRRSTLMPAQAATPASTQMAAVGPPKKVPVVSTLLIAAAVMAAIAAVAWIAIPDGSQGSSKDPAAVGDHRAQQEDASETPPTVDSVTKVRVKPKSDAEAPAEDNTEAPAKKSVTPKRRRWATSKAPPPPPAPVKNPLLAALLKQAQKELEAGQYKQASLTAMRAYKIERQPRSFAIKVKAKCHLSDLSNANGALRNIAMRHRALRRSLQSYCKRLGLNLNMMPPTN